MNLRAATALLFLACLGVKAQVNDSTPVIEAAGRSITKAEFEQMFAGDARLARAKIEPAVKLTLGTDVGKAFALEAEARNRKLDQLPSVQLKIRSYSTQLLAQELLVSARNAYLNDEAALAILYEKNKQAFEEPRVRQILVRFKGSEAAAPKGKRELTPEQARIKAQALLIKLSNGADFAKLAKAESDDIGSLPTGGDIGFVRKVSTDVAFENAVYTLPVGKVSEVIRTRFGYHIVRVEERRSLGLNAVKGILANELAHKELDGVILNGYKLNMDYFGH